MFQTLKLSRVAPVMLAGVVTCGVAAAASAPASAAANSSGPKVISFRTNPVALKYTGGSVRLLGRTTGAAKCRFSSSPPAVGLPQTIACSGGSPRVTIHMGRYTGETGRNFAFTLQAIAADNDSASESISFHQTPPPPTVTSFTASRSVLPSSGGTVTLQAVVRRALACVFSSKPPLGGLPASVPCSGGTASLTLQLPSATTGATVAYGIAVAVTGSGGRSTGRATVEVTGLQPYVSGFSASPTVLPDTGGKVTLTADIANGIVCGFADRWKGGQADPILKPAFPVTEKCDSGLLTLTVKIGPDSSTLRDLITFSMDVASDGGKKTAVNEPVVTLRGQPKS
jgi:hypothetical protein